MRYKLFIKSSRPLPVTHPKPRLGPGTAVTVQGLRGQPKWNGTRGLVLSIDKVQGRYRLLVKGLAHPLGVRLECCTLESMVKQKRQLLAYVAEQQQPQRGKPTGAWCHPSCSPAQSGGRDHGLVCVLWRAAWGGCAHCRRCVCDRWREQPSPRGPGTRAWGLGAARHYTWHKSRVKEISILELKEFTDHFPLGQIMANVKQMRKPSYAYIRDPCSSTLAVACPSMPHLGFCCRCGQCSS